MSTIRRLLHRSVPAAAAAALILVVALSAASAAPAAASGTPGWRIVQVLPGVTSGDELPGLTVGGLAAPGPRDAWLVGTNGATAIVRHWDGKAWRGLTPPKDLINSPFDQGIETMTASSASNLWIFDARGPDSSVINSEALHWTGRKWAAPDVINSETIGPVIALSSTDVWAIGDLGVPYHFNGKTWTTARIPIGVGAFSALSATDMWAVGGTSKGFGAARWNGRTWHVTPTLHLSSAISQGLIMGAAALTDSNVWADIWVTVGTPHTVLVHWNGKAWKRAAFPYDAWAPVPGPITADGHGGLWLGLVTDPYAAAPVYWLAHLSDGRWTKTAVPRWHGRQPAISFMSRIPGTRSVWGVADTTELPNDTMILKYGP